MKLKIWLSEYGNAIIAIFVTIGIPILAVFLYNGVSSSENTKISQSLKDDSVREVRYNKGIENKKYFMASLAKQTGAYWGGLTENSIHEMYYSSQIQDELLKFNNLYLLDDIDVSDIYYHDSSRYAIINDYPFIITAIIDSVSYRELTTDKPGKCALVKFMTIRKPGLVSEIQCDVKDEFDNCIDPRIYIRSDYKDDKFIITGELIKIYTPT